MTFFKAYHDCLGLIAHQNQDLSFLLHVYPSLSASFSSSIITEMESVTDVRMLPSVKAVAAGKSQVTGLKFMRRRAREIDTLTDKVPLFLPAAAAAAAIDASHRYTSFFFWH